MLNYFKIWRNTIHDQWGTIGNLLIEKKISAQRSTWSNQTKKLKNTPTRQLEYKYMYEYVIYYVRTVCKTLTNRPLYLILRTILHFIWHFYFHQSSRSCFAVLNFTAILVFSLGLKCVPWMNASGVVSHSRDIAGFTASKALYWNKTARGEIHRMYRKMLHLNRLFNSCKKYRSEGRHCNSTEKFILIIKNNLKIVC